MSNMPLNAVADDLARRPDFDRSKHILEVRRTRETILVVAAIFVAADLHSRPAGGLLIVRLSTILLVITTKETTNMAKYKHNKSALIREYMAKKPDATANEIVDALAAKKVKVTTAYIYALKAKNGKPKAGKAKSATLGGVEALVKAKRMADQLGGVDKARELLATLAQLV